MKKLMTFCFIILLSVLSALSCANFAFDAIDQIEKDKITVHIEKPQNISNAEFLAEIDNAVKKADADIMLRQVENVSGKDHYQYFKTNHTENFLKISTSAAKNQLKNGECISTLEPVGYKAYRLNVASLMQDITFYPWADAEYLDLSAVTYYVKKEQQSVVTDAITELGYSVMVHPAAYVPGKFPVLLFGFIPAFMFVISMAFYALSGGKKNVIKKMEGYKTFDIMLDEAKSVCPIFAGSFLIVETVTLIAAAVLYRKALPQFILFSLPNILIVFIAVLAGGAVSTVLIGRQKSAEYIKGRVPRRGIYIITIAAKGVFLGFMIFFLSIAIRNAAIAHHTVQTFRFFADKMDGYVTIPVSNSSVAMKDTAKNYKAFYLATVDRYNGVLVDASNYEYDLIRGKTLAEEFGQTEITVNRNYLDINPIYAANGSRITEKQLSDTAFNVLIPVEKEAEKEYWREYIQTSYGMKANFISYDSKASKIYSYNADTGTGAYGELKEPVIFVAEQEQIEGALVLSYCSQGAYFLKVPSENAYAELLPILQQTGIDSITRETPSLAAAFSKAVNHQQKMLALYGTQSVVLLTGLICLIVFSVRLYCENDKKRIACCLIEGYSVLHCIRKHLMITAVYYAIVAMGLGFVSMTMQLSLNYLLLPAALIGEVAITFIVSRGCTEKNLYQIVKGAE